LGCKPIPVVAVGTLPQMVWHVTQGVLSKWGNFPAEGLVARTLTGLLDRNGNRIIGKLKAKDF
jgi:hypothetical protein